MSTEPTPIATPTPSSTPAPTPTPAPVVHKRHAVKIVREVVPDPSQIKPPSHRSKFSRFSNGISSKAGSPYALMGAIFIVIIWALSGPVFHYSETWQLMINTGTTIITFLMVFAIQNSQNRDSKAMQIKLDELIKANRGARAEFVDIEDLTDSELETLHTEFRELHAKFQDRAAAKQNLQK
jgi:low affinity Fe/Cu permease